MLTFRDRIWILLKEEKDKDTNFRRKDFAAMLGTSLKKVNARLDGNGRPDYETLKTIAKNAGVSVAWLIGETESKNIPIYTESTNHLPEQAQKEYHFIMDYLQFKYGVRSALKRLK